MKLTDANKNGQFLKRSKLPSKTNYSFDFWVKNWDQEFGLKPIEV